MPGLGTFPSAGWPMDTCAPKVYLAVLSAIRLGTAASTKAPE